MSRHIYLGEHCPQQQQSLQGMLAKLATVTVFTDGFSLYEQIHQNPPNVLLVNLFLPPMDPFLMIRLLKFDSRFLQLPILCLTSLVEPGLSERLRRLGARSSILHSEPALILEAVSTLLRYP